MVIYTVLTLISLPSRAVIKPSQEG